MGGSRRGARRRERGYCSLKAAALEKVELPEVKNCACACRADPISTEGIRLGNAIVAIPLASVVKVDPAA